MSVVIRQPTQNETPDTGQSGLAVTGISNTGHGSTVTQSSASASAPLGNASDSDAKSARWFGLQEVSGQKTLVKLKFSWTASGNAQVSNESGGSGSASASFQIQYSLNGGGSWNTHVSDSADAILGGTNPDSFTNNNSADITLSNAQNVSQIQVRCLYQTSVNVNAGADFGTDGNSDVTVTISDIQVEVTVVPQNTAGFMFG